MSIKKLYLSLLVLLLNGCSGVTIPNIKVCAVAGTMSAGADCAYTLSDETESMSFDEFLAFLQPTDTRGSALCQSAEDWTKLKTAIEIACKKLGSACNKEVKEQLKTVTYRMDNLQKKSKSAAINPLTKKPYVIP